MVAPGIEEQVRIKSMSQRSSSSCLHAIADWGVVCTASVLSGGVGAGAGRVDDPRSGEDPDGNNVALVGADRSVDGDVGRCDGKKEEELEEVHVEREQMRGGVRPKKSGQV